MAEELYHALKSIGINVFYSYISIAEKGEHRFGNMINDAIEECSIFIAVGTSIENLQSRWVKYEIECFNGEMLNGNKVMEKSAMFSYVTKNVPTNHLPMELRRCQAFFALEDVVNAVCARFKNEDEIKRTFNFQNDRPPIKVIHSDNGYDTEVLRKETEPDDCNDLFAAADAPAEPVTVGMLVDERYEILSKIGVGGMSTVYLAMDVRLKVVRAVKVIRTDKLFGGDAVKLSIHAEIDMMKKLDHHGVPHIFDVIDNGSDLIVVMEYIEGSPLNNILKDSETQPENVVIGWGKDICDILSHMHDRKTPIIHRDVKPANIILKPDGHLCLIDFGTAREYKREKTSDTTCLGTVGYAAPEQYGGMGQTDPRTDIYSLGVTLHYLCTGREPTKPPYEIVPLRQINKDFSYGLEYIIGKCTQRDPEKRYQSAAELKKDLENIDEISKKMRRKNFFKDIKDFLKKY